MRNPSVYFTMSDNDIMAFLSYVPSERWEYEVKRVFVLMLYTGADVQDARKFNRENISADGTRFFYTTSNGMDVSIDMNPMIERYIDTSVTTPRSTHYFTKAIRTIFRYAEMNGPVFDNEGKRRKMCDVIYMSVARYTFATKRYHEGYSLLQIMDMMGTTSRVFITRAIQGYKKRAYNSRT